jgi:hypothetical protein
MPKALDGSFGKYLEYKSAAELNNSIAALGKDLEKKLADYRQADNIVRQVNPMKLEKDYSGMLGILKQHMQLDFLMDKYRGLDQMSVEEQARNIREGLKKFHWGKAESGLTRLHRDDNFLDPVKIKPLKNKTVYNLEDSLYIKVDQITRSRVSKFCEENISVLENVDSLYTDSVFLPAHDIKFSSGTKSELIQRKNDLVEHLAKLKENEFPAKAITLLYKEFMRKPSDNGVLKARAVVAHGKHYKGEDKKIKRQMAELDPWSAKWIVKPAKYRRVFALPISTKKRGTNTYLFRMNIRIPTEAKFPVYDVNMKLPKYVAKNAAAKQWYEKMLMNKKPLKNEGRFTITAPTAANEYECQATPVRMNPDKSNYLEVYFKYPAFRPIPVSVMAQKPIIKKH